MALKFDPMQPTFFINHGGGPCFFLEPAFDDWLRSAMRYVDARDSELAAWAEAPGARHAHPYEDHLIPLMVAAGAASGELAQLDFYGHVLGKPISGFRFG